MFIFDYGRIDTLTHYKFVFPTETIADSPICFDCDADHLAVFSWDMTLRVYSILTKEQIRVFVMDEKLNQICIFHRYLIVLTERGVIQAIEFESEKVSYTFPVSHFSEGARIGILAESLFLTTDFSEILFYNIHTGKQLKQQKMPKGVKQISSSMTNLYFLMENGQIHSFESNLQPFSVQATNIHVSENFISMINNTQFLQMTHEGNILNSFTIKPQSQSALCDNGIIEYDQNVLRKTTKEEKIELVLEDSDITGIHVFENGCIVTTDDTLYFVDNYFNEILRIEVFSGIFNMPFYLSRTEELIFLSYNHELIKYNCREKIIECIYKENRFIGSMVAFHEERNYLCVLFGVDVIFFDLAKFQIISTITLYEHRGKLFLEFSKDGKYLKISGEHNWIPDRIAQYPGSEYYYSTETMKRLNQVSEKIINLEYDISWYISSIRARVISNTIILVND